MLDSRVIVLHRFVTDVTTEDSSQMCALYVIGLRGLSGENLATDRARVGAPLMESFMDFQTFAVQKRSAAYVAYAVRVVHVQMGGEGSEYMESVTAYMATVWTTVQFVVGNALSVNRLFVTF